MSWDSSRPVPWRRLFKEAGLYAVLVGVSFLVIFRDQPPASIISGLIFGTALYLTVGWAMAKFGVQRKSPAERRAELKAQKAADEPAKESGRSTSTRSRPKPAPTRRTNASTANRPAKKRRKR